MLLQRISIHTIGVLLILAALVMLPGASLAETTDASVALDKAVAWLHTQQLEDGGFGFRRPDGSATTDAKTTADVVYALALAGENVTGPAWTINGKTPLDALAALAPAYIGSDAGQAGKVARAVVLAGGDPHDFAGMDVIAVIQAAYDPATGRYHPSFLFRHTLAVEALIRSGEPAPPAALAALRTAQLPDGGWFWAFGASTSDVDTTGRVMHLLAGVAEQGCVPGHKRAVGYLANAQLAGGGWGVYPAPDTNPANGNSTGLALAGLRAMGVTADAAPFVKAGKSAWAHLLSFQEDSGAFVYINQPNKQEVRIMATVDAISALIQPVGPAQLCPRVVLPMLLAR